MMTNREELEKLLAAVGDGELGERQAKQLLEYVREDEEVLRRFGSVVATERLLSAALSTDAGEHFSRGTVERLSFQEEKRSQEDFVIGVVEKLRPRKVIRVGWIGGLAAVAAIVLSLFLILNESAIEESAEIVAKIVGSETGDDSVGGKTELRVGNRVAIDDGLLEIEFLTGVTVVLNGPVDFEITGRKSGYLHHGRLVAEVEDERGKGFTIDGSNGRLVDLGTKFGVAVDRKGEMEVHVIEGVVDAEVKNGATTRLRENEAMRLGGDQAGTVVEADAGAFFTRMPPELASSPKFVRWSFDETEGEVCFDSGRELGEGNASASFKVDPEGGKSPERIAGRFSNGLHLSGSGYLASQFGGVEHAGARTVAFWVRVPKDFGDSEGFGIVNWGSYVKEGAAWQIAINSVLRDGHLGRLRIGTHMGQVVGVTDLRDGEWHHCAVVLYGDEDEKPNLSTHVLLYVDGRIESASRKSVIVVDTVRPTLEQQAGSKIWIGRNLGHRAGLNTAPHGDYFRGDLDELIISDQALNHRQINELMNTNKMPHDDE